MLMEPTVKDRLIAFIEHKGITKNKFETLCGLSKRYVSNISQSISPKVAKRISLTFPELNMGWVLTGEGEMLPTEQKPSESGLASGDVMKINLNLSETIKEQQSTIAALTEIVNRLTIK